jgi:hypothetical protein
MFDFYKEPVDWRNTNSGTDFGARLDMSFYDSCGVMSEIFACMGLPYLHCCWDIHDVFSQEQRYARLIRLALGRNECDPLPDRNEIDLDQWFVGPRWSMQFDPSLVPGGRGCSHFFGITSFNYDTRTHFTPALRGLHCSFCGKRFTRLPLVYGFLMNFGCVPPIPLLIVALCYAANFGFKPDRPVPPLPFGLVPGGEFLDGD